MNPVENAILLDEKSYNEKYEKISENPVKWKN
jgi:hypothetical protein